MVLAFVGFKMLLPLVGHLYGFFAGVEQPHWRVNKFAALGVILLALVCSVLASLVWPKRAKAVEIAPGAGRIGRGALGTELRH